MDYEAIKQGLVAAVPFARHVGLDYAELTGGRAVVRLPDRPELANHVATQHAGALFTAAESASGAAFVSVFAERMGALVPVVRDATIHFRRPARGPIDAEATLTTPPEELFASLDANGAVDFTIEVELRDADGATVGTSTVSWNVKQR